LRREWLIALTGLGAGTAIGMWITDRFEWFSFVSLAILVTIYFYLKQLRRKKNRNSRNRRADPEKCAAGSPLHPARPDRRRRAGARLDDISRPTDSSGIYCGLLPVQPVHPVGGAGRREAKIRAADKSGFKSCDPARLCVIICTIIRNIVPARRRSLPHPDTREEDPALSPFISALRLIDRYFILWLLIVSCIAYFFRPPSPGSVRGSRSFWASSCSAWEPPFRRMISASS